MLQPLVRPLVSSLILLLAVAAPTTLAGTLKVPAQFATIGDAAAMALPGDIISVSAGVYYETVTLGVANVTLKGSGTCILDARADGQPHGAGIIITATGVTVSNITVRHALTDDANTGDGIRSMADGTTLDKVKVFNSGNAGFDATANGVTVLNSFFDANDGGVVIDGDEALVEKTTVRNDDANGITVTGSNAVIRKCSALAIDDGDGIAVQGDNALIESCTVTDPDLHGISVNGLNPTIRKNKVSWIGADDDAIVVMNATTGGTVEGNTITDTIQLGILVDNGNLLVITGNKVERVGAKDDASIRVSGDGNTLSGNTIKDGGNDGIRLDGDGNTLSGNKVTACATDGIHVTDGTGNVITGNTLTGNLGEGIDNGGDATICTLNKAKQNRTDIANDGIFAEFSGNTFETGGEDVLPQID